MNRKTRHTRTFTEYIYETYKNKLVAIALIILGMVPVMLDGDATALMLLGFFAVPLFFTNKNCVF